MRLGGRLASPNGRLGPRPQAEVGNQWLYGVCPPPRSQGLRLPGCSADTNATPPGGTSAQLDKSLVQVEGLSKVEAGPHGLRFSALLRGASGCSRAHRGPGAHRVGCGLGQPSPQVRRGSCGLWQPWVWLNYQRIPP